MSLPLRHARALRTGCFAIAAVAAVALARALPFGTAFDWLEREVAGLGAWGWLAFALAYVAAALAFAPGSVLTLAAGAIFGLWLGTALVSVASVTAATLAFLIARHLARDRVAGLAARSRRFGAVDRAIGRGGWRVIALLRLSPAVPFSIGNYLFGLTRIGLVPYALASWVAMLPGTFLYVYLGYAGRAAAAGGRGAAEWLLLGVGLLATAAVTVYITRLARAELASDAEVQAPATPSSSPTSLTWPAALAAVMVVLAALALGFEAEIARALGAPSPSMP